MTSTRLSETKARAIIYYLLMVAISDRVGFYMIDRANVGTVARFVSIYNLTEHFRLCTALPVNR